MTYHIQGLVNEIINRFLIRNFGGQKKKKMESRRQWPNIFKMLKEGVPRWLSGLIVQFLASAKVMISGLWKWDLCQAPCTVRSLFESLYHFLFLCPSPHPVSLFLSQIKQYRFLKMLKEKKINNKILYSAKLPIKSQGELDSPS